MDALCYDIMEMIGHEVQIVRETAQIKGNYQKVVYDVNSIHSRCYILDDLDDRNFTITDLFQTKRMDPPWITNAAPFLPRGMYQLLDHEVPADYKGTPGLCECGCCGVTCIINPEQD